MVKQSNIRRKKRRFAGNRFATAAPPDARDYIVEEEEAEEGEAEENVTPAQNSALIIAVDTNETVADPSTQEKETGNAPSDKNGTGV